MMFKIAQIKAMAKEFSTPNISRRIKYRINKIVICNKTPEKYLVNKFSILTNENFSFFLCFEGNWLNKVLKICFPSFKKKKVINNTDIIPILKLPI